MGGSLLNYLDNRRKDSWLNFHLMQPEVLSSEALCWKIMTGENKEVLWQQKNLFFNQPSTEVLLELPVHNRKIPEQCEFTLRSNNGRS